MKIKDISLRKLILTNLLLLMLVFGFLFSEKKEASAQQSLSDAIAVRIIPNPNHLSAQRWYQSQGFAGSPQSLLVNGYKAVRDGRTVYVSATNIIGNDFFTNIYLISYNQEADSQTVDIFGQIIKNWKFNTNLSDAGTDIGECRISKRNCYNDSDCSSGYFCETTGAQINKCLLNDSSPDVDIPSCIIDSDCPGDLFCDGLKAKIIRDLDRLEKVMLIEDKLNQYNQKNGNYPILGAGTYLSHVAVSTWPSWQNAFLSQIGVSNALDPINKLGSCADADEKFNLDTCWNAVNNIFYSQGNYNSLPLPLGSHAMAYTTNPNGSDYKLCATMETSGYQITQGVLASHSCSIASAGNIGLVGNNANNAPYVLEANLSGQSGQEFKGFVKAVDPEGHPFTWSSNFNSNFTGWSSTPQLLNTNNPNQKMIYASNAGNSGTYSFSLTFVDSLGSSSTETLNINITNPGPQIIGGNVSHNLSYGLPFSNIININSVNQLSPLTICQSDSSGNCIPSSIVFSVNPVTHNCPVTTIIDNGFNACLSTVVDGKYELKISGTPPKGDYYYKIIASDNYGGSNSIVIKIEILATPPAVSFNNCLKVANLGDYYECELKTVNPLVDPDFSTTITPLPKGLVFDVLDEKIKGYPLEMGAGQTIEIRVEDEIGLSSVGSFDLNVTSSCGNDMVQYTGGPWNFSGTTRNHSGYYRTVLIGNQCWLQDNLNIGTEISHFDVGLSPDPFGDETIEKYCYNNSAINCDIYGGLYDFTEALVLPRTCLSSGAIACQDYNRKGACPPGWRVPTDSDWHILELGLNGSGSCDANRSGSLVNGVISGWGCDGAGGALKSSGQSGFKALFINYLDYSLISPGHPGPFKTPFDKYANFWSSTYSSNNNAFSRHIEKGTNELEIARAGGSKGNGYSVRCIKDSSQCQQSSECPSGHTCLQNICVITSGGGGISPQQPIGGTISQ